MSTAVYFVYTSGRLSTPCKLSAFGYSGGSARMQMLAVSSRNTTAIGLNTTTAGLVNDSMRNDGFRWLVSAEHVHVNSPPYDALARVKNTKITPSAIGRSLSHIQSRVLKTYSLFKIFWRSGQRGGPSPSGPPLNTPLPVGHCYPDGLV